MEGKERMLDKESKTLKLENMTKQSMNKHQISRSELSKKISLQEKGITLIALVVTIIILLILAGVTLNMALSDNGLFSKTQEAADKYKYAQSDEEEMVRQIATQMYSEYVGAEVTGYTPTGTSETCTLVTENTGYESPQTFTRKEMTWRVWDFDGNTLRLIGEPTEEKLNLKGVKGYNNGVWSMDHICKELYSNEEIGATATTLKRSDILKVSTFDFTKYKHNANNWEAGNDESQSINYGYSKTFNEGTFNYPDIWYSNDKKWPYTKEEQVDKYGEIFETIGNTDGTNEKMGTNDNEKITCKDCYSSANLEGNLINNKYLDLLIGNIKVGISGYCWLGTRDIEIVNDIAYFSLASIGRKINAACEYGIIGLYKSTGNDLEIDVGCRVIPVVSINLNDKGYTLEKDLEKSKEGSDVYKLKFD